jgi:hypothetical protein
MTRAISVLIGVVLLLGVGWYVGHRPSAGLSKQLATLQEDCERRTTELEQRAQTAEARGRLWEARAELLLASHDVEDRNFGTANERATRAHDLITEAAGDPGITLDLKPVQDMVSSAVGKVGALDPEAGGVLARAASELGRLLEKTGQA